MADRRGVGNWLGKAGDLGKKTFLLWRGHVVADGRRALTVAGLLALVLVASCSALASRGDRLSLGLPAQTQSLDAGAQALTAPSTQEETDGATLAAEETQRLKLFDKIVDLPPRATDSYYVHTIEPAALDRLGCSGGQQTIGQRPGQDDLVILQFGAPRQRNLLEGAHLYEPTGVPSTGFASMAQIATAAQAFAGGYARCAEHTARLTLVLGTTNWGSNVTKFHGTAWGNMVKKAAASVAETPFGQRVTILGGADLEMDWNKPATTRAWLDAYVASWAPTLIQYGDAGGCPTSDNGSEKCNNGWTLDDVWYVSWGTGGTLPMPQIYNGAMAKQWYLLKRYSLSKPERPPMVIAGILTMSGNCRQVGGCTTGFDLEPADAYRQLTSLLSAEPATAQNITYASDIKLAWKP